MKNNSFYFVLKSVDNGLYFKDADLLSITYTDNIHNALIFSNTEDLKQFMLYLLISFPNTLFTPTKVVLKEYNFICH